MKFLAAAVQMLPSSDKGANLKEAELWVRKASTAGAKLVVLPEIFNFRGAEGTISAEPIPGPTTRWMGELASELEIYFLAGSILETIPNEKKVYNTSLLFSPQGKLLAKYRKIHLFDVHVGKMISLESETRMVGLEVVLGQTEFCPNNS